jgi:flagellar FliL protein
MAEEEVQEEPKKSGGKGLIIVLLVIVILLLIGVGALAFLLLTGDKEADSSASDTEVHGSAEHGDGSEVPASEFSHAKEYSPKYKQFEPPPPETPPMYFTMDKFVVNFNGDGQAKFLAVDLKFLSYYPQVVGDTGEMENLRPILKNDIERLLRNQHYNELIKLDGPDKLRAEILDVARKVLEKHKIYPDLLEDVYMTRFVMQ